MANEKTNDKTSRRRFIKYVGAGVVVVGVAGAAAYYGTQAPSPPGLTQTAASTATSSLGPTETTTFTEPIVIRGIHEWGTPGEIANTNNIEGKFAQEYPQYKVDISSISSDDMRALTMAAIAGGGTLEIVDLFTGLYIEIAKENVLTDMTDIINVYKDQWYPSALTSANFEGSGTYYMFPSYVTPGPWVWWRKNVFEELGLPEPPYEGDDAFDKYLTMLKQAKDEGTRKYGKPFWGGVLPAGRSLFVSFLFYSFLWGNNMSAFDSDFNFILDKEPVKSEAIEILRFMKKCYDLSVPGSSSFEWFEAIDSFITGNMASSIYWGRMVGQVDDRAPDIAKEMDVAFLPHKKRKNPMVEVGGYGVLKDAKHAKEAMTFFEWLNRPENYAYLGLNVPLYSYPCRKDAVAQPVYLNDPLIQKYKHFAEWIPEQGATYGIDFLFEHLVMDPQGNPKPNTKWADLQGNMWDVDMCQKVLLQNQDPKAAVEWMGEQVRKAGL